MNTACTFCGCTPWFFSSVVSILNRRTLNGLHSQANNSALACGQFDSRPPLFFLFLFNSCYVYKSALENNCILRNSTVVRDPLCLPCKEWWKSKAWRVCCPPEGFSVTNLWLQISSGKKEPQKVVTAVLHLCREVGGSRRGRKR